MKLVLIFFSLCILASIASILTKYLKENLYKYFKLIPIFILFILLLVLSVLSGGNYFSYLVAAGLLLSMFGDFFLLDESRYLIPGMISFSFAHIIYIAAFFNTDLSISIPGIVMIIFSIIYILTIRTFLRTGFQKKMFFPVVIYCTLLTLMNLSAHSYEAARGGLSILSIGAALFYVSDAFLSWEVLVEKYRASSFVILATYYSAQMLIAYKAVQSILSSQVL
ncbi:MAG: lysoplasmalogenase [Spirochaetes bacterium]|nr:lysoplasmalogenase [Spirochaetota bacterium]